MTTMQKQSKGWRSLLFVPVNVERFVDKAHTRGADAIILDLEDAVAPSQKDHARTLVKKAAETVGRGGSDVMVRINRPWRVAIRDLEASICPAVHALWLPKVDSPEHVQIISEITTELEIEQRMTPGSTRLLPMIETPTGFLRVREIAASDERVVGIGLGAGDFSSSTGINPDAEGLAYPSLEVIIAARATGCIPLGLVSTIIDYTDLDGFRAIARASRKLGWQGSCCIHPNQVRILNEEFRPTKEEIDKARRLVAALERAIAEGKGAIEFEGEMADIAVMIGAQALLDRYETIRDRDQRTCTSSDQLGH